MLGREEQEYEIDRLPVDRIEIDRIGEPCEHAVDMGQRLDLSMRDRNALAEPGRAEFLTLKQRVEDQPVLDTCHRAGGVGQFLQKVFLALDPEVRENRAGIDEVGKK